MENNLHVRMDDVRQTLCLEAAWEIDALARLLPGLVPKDDAGAHYAVRGVAGRLVRLADVLMSALGDENEATEDLAQIIGLQKGQG